MDYEYCVMHKFYPDEPHRGPWPEQQCREWIEETENDGFPQSYFYLAYRKVGPWNRV